MSYETMMLRMRYTIYLFVAVVGNIRLSLAFRSRIALSSTIISGRRRTLTRLKQRDYDLTETINDLETTTRRDLLYRSFVTTAVTVSSLLIKPQHVEAVTTTSTQSSSSSAAQTFISPSEAKVTDKVFMNIRISRSDGTFYVRDDLPDTPENRVLNCRLVIGLFGKNAPTHVERFLSYIKTGNDSDPLGDNPLPNYGRSYFTSLDQATGLLLGGMIPSLELTEIGGSTAIRYGGRILPAPLWVERPQQQESLPPPRISHSAKGLLTHQVLDATPVFGITTRSDTSEIDRTHTVFGTILFGESSTDAADFINTVRDLPTYSVDRPASSAAFDPSKENTVVEDAAGAVFNAQRDFFRKAAKTFGDTRLDKVYEGKLLRRVQVTQVGML